MSDNIVIVTGSRNYHGPLIGQALQRELDEVANAASARAARDPKADWRYRLIVIHGAARGADHAAAQWASQSRPSDWRVSLRSFPADWLKHGKAAGMIRNRAMLEAAIAMAREIGATLKCLAFPSPQSRGTRGMIKLCQAAGLETVIIEVNCD